MFPSTYNRALDCQKMAEVYIKRKFKAIQQWQPQALIETLPYSLKMFTTFVKNQQLDYPNVYFFLDFTWT